jgi:hypothetical protein
MSWSGYIPGHLANDPDFIKFMQDDLAVAAVENEAEFDPHTVMLQGEDREIISSG